MISKKNFFTISVMMVVVFFLFMVTGGAKQALSNYEENEYVPTSWTVSDTSEADFSLSTGGVLYLGDSQKVLNRLKEWCYYNQRGLKKLDHGVGYDGTEETLSMLVVDGASLTDKDEDVLLEASETGLTLVFATMPSCEYLQEHTNVAQLMGIRAIQKESTSLVGMHLYEGFLLGGEKVYELGDEDPLYYQDMNLRIPWYILESASKVYMSGYLNKVYKDADVSYTPPIIWRYNTKNGYVYAINNNFMEDLSALGIYTAVESTREEIAIYPVINAKSLVVTNYPTFTEENEEQISELYSRNTTNYLETLVWPTITAVSSYNKMKPGFFISAKLDYDSENGPSEKALHYFMELIRENHGEAGLSLDAYSDISAEEKLSIDLEFFKDTLEDYHFYSCYVGDSDLEEALTLLNTTGENISLVVSDYNKNQNLIWAQDNVIGVSETTSSQYYSFTKDFTLKSVETALGYSMASVDASSLVYPKTTASHLQNFTEDYSGTINSLYENFEDFEATSLTETGNRIRNYLNLDYDADVSMEKDRVTITTNTYGEEQFFILKIPDMEIRSISQGEYEELEDGVYLVTTTSSETVIKLKEKDQSLLKYFR